MPFASSSLPRTKGRTALDHRHVGIYKTENLKITADKISKERTPRQSHRAGCHIASEP